ncbi:Non-specific serine/threonine protein kinase [Bertholletia excelsa]
MEARWLAMILLNFVLFSPVLGLDNSTDQQALLAFESQINFDPFGVLQSWNSSTSLCNWRGVQCNFTNRVTSLSLENLGLAGTISPHISNLSFLTKLNLKNNSFHGSLPREIGRLFRLESLLMDSNQLQGTIPESLSSCQRLVHIELSGNRLEGTIPPGLGSLSKLEVISFMDNFLTGEIPSSFGNLTSLTNLILLTNDLQGPLPDGLGHLPSLVNLQIGLNNFVGEIPSSIFNRSSLIQLGLAGNKLSGTLPADMFLKLPNLQILYLGGNQFSGTIPASLANASQLVRIDLSSNNLTGHIPLSSKLVSLEVLSLQTNQFVSDGNGGMDFFTSLSNSSQLKVFALATNQLTGELPSTIGNLSRHLSLLVIGDNRFEGSLPKEMGNLVGLTMLSLEYNSFSGEIPPSIGDLPVLQNLYLHNNGFSGKIPESLGNLSELSEMSLKHNLLTGVIPSSLGKYQHIQVLDLSANMLFGEIPKEIFEMKSFGKLLNLSWNGLNGSLPQEIGNLKMIGGVDVSSNRFTGDIPISIGDCSSLFYLNLSRNSFQGSIPKSVGNLKGMEYIDLSLNNLSGQIPSSLENLRFLQLLDLSENNLYGEVPKGGVFGNETALSLFGNPKLCGLMVGSVGALTLFGVLFVTLRKKEARKPKIDAEALPVRVQHILYKREELKAATRNFSPENLIGEGSFGTVYKGAFGDGTMVAIKVFKMDQNKASKSFLAECEALRNIRHRNLVGIISVCSTGDFKALVLQFMPNGSLDRWIHERKEMAREERRLGMRERLEIAQDVASAMEYMHHDCENPVVHCDLKPSNVLLDQNMTAHVADFGLARIGIDTSSKNPVSSTLGLKGSIGYIAPEYGVGGEVSTKGDVYSFGILMLEMFTGKRPTDEMFTEEMDLQRWVSTGLPHCLADLAGHELLGKEGDSISADCLVGILKIGLKCAVKPPDVRPTMREVSMMIEDVRAEFFN